MSAHIRVPRSFKRPRSVGAATTPFKRPKWLAVEHWDDLTDEQRAFALSGDDGRKAYDTFVAELKAAEEAEEADETDGDNSADETDTSEAEEDGETEEEGKEVSEEEAREMQKRAASAAEKAAGDEHLSATIHDLIESADKVKVGPIMVFRDLERIYGADLNGFPRVGSKDEEGKQTNETVDLYKYKALVDGEWKDKTGSWYRDFYDRLPEGKAALHIVALIDDVKADPEKARRRNNPYVDLSDEQRAVIRSQANTNYNTGLGYLRRAMRLHWKVYDVKALPGLTVELDDDIVLQDGAKVRNLRPVCLASTVNRRHIKFMPISAFLNIDYTKVPEEAKAPGKNLVEALAATARKKRKKGTDAQTQQGGGTVSVKADYVDLSIAKIEQLQNICNAIAHFGEDKKRQTEVEKALNPRRSGSDELVLALGAAFSVLVPLCDNEAFQDRYGKLERQQSLPHTPSESKAA